MGHGILVRMCITADKNVPFPDKYKSNLRWTSHSCAFKDSAEYYVEFIGSTCTWIPNELKKAIVDEFITRMHPHQVTGYAVEEDYRLLYKKDKV